MVADKEKRFFFVGKKIKFTDIQQCLDRRHTTSDSKMANANTNKNAVAFSRSHRLSSTSMLTTHERRTRYKQINAIPKHQQQIAGEGRATTATIAQNVTREKREKQKKRKHQKYKNKNE